MSQSAHKLFFGTLANLNRLQIIDTLRKSSLNVSEICEKTGFNQTTTSHNLKRLLRCGFISVERKGKERIYSLNQATIGPLMKLIDSHMNTYCKKVLEEEKEDG